MEISILVAQMLAVMYLAAAIAALTGAMNYAKVVSDFEQSQGLTFVTGFLTIIFGLTVVHYHNIWEQNWTVLVTLVGWISVVKGFVLIAFPRVLGSFRNLYQNTKVWGVIMLVLAAVFGYFGFVV